jgi:hypothetical protein
VKKVSLNLLNAWRYVDLLEVTNPPVKVGFEDGARDGETVGYGVGGLDGAIDGGLVMVGAGVGGAVGVFDGAEEMVGFGDIVGLSVGALVGGNEGFSDGNSEGDFVVGIGVNVVGASVGTKVGCDVDGAVGASVPPSSGGAGGSCAVASVQRLRRAIKGRPRSFQRAPDVLLSRLQSFEGGITGGRGASSVDSGFVMTGKGTRIRSWVTCRT